MLYKTSVKSEATHQAAMEIIDAEKRKRDQKTARLRAAREAAGIPLHPSKKKKTAAKPKAR